MRGNTDLSLLRDCPQMCLNPRSGTFPARLLPSPPTCCCKTPPGGVSAADPRLFLLFLGAQMVPISGISSSIMNVVSGAVRCDVPWQLAHSVIRLFIASSPRLLRDFRWRDSQIGRRTTESAASTVSFEHLIPKCVILGQGELQSRPFLTKIED
jgi:hypothetical protein